MYTLYFRDLNTGDEGIWALDLTRTQLLDELGAIDEAGRIHELWSVNHDTGEVEAW